MSLHIKSLNADATFLLTFTPSIAPNRSSRELFPGSFTVIIDPWLESATHVYHPKFSSTTRTGTSCIASLAELEREPDLVVCSQDKPDHCNKATLTRLPPDCASHFVSTSAAIRKIRSWNHFDPSACTALPSYDANNPKTVFRIPLPPPSPRGVPGEATVSILAPSFDISGLHNAIGITYRPPSNVLSQKSRSYINTPRPDVRAAAATGTTTTTTTTTVLQNREPTLSVLYAPHGLPYPVVKAWAQTHLVREAALPLTALLHNFDEIENPWYLGGTIAHGLRGGREIAKYLMPEAWIGVHDEDKALAGFAVKLMRTRKVGAQEVKQKLLEDGVDVEDEPKDYLGHFEHPGGFADTTTTRRANLKRVGTRGKKMKVVVLGVGEEMTFNS